MAIRIVTDTTANLPQETLDEYGIPTVPQYVIFGEESLKDVFEISSTEFYRRQAISPILPKTSAPSVGEFEEVFAKILREDPKATILCIHPSSEVSGTVRSARPAAAAFPTADIRVFDTRSISAGLGMMVLKAAQMVRAGADIDAVMAQLEAMRDGMRIYFVPATLDYLAKGGRIGRASHLLGTLLDIKPILRMTDGTVESYSKERTHKRALAALRDIALAELQGKRGVFFGVIHAACEEEARALADELCPHFETEMYLFAQAGPAIGVHAGPGTIGLCWYVPKEV